MRVSARRRWFPEVEQSSYELEEEWKVVGGAGRGEGIKTWKVLKINEEFSVQSVSEQLNQFPLGLLFCFYEIYEN